MQLPVTNIVLLILQVNVFIFKLKFDLKKLF